MRKNTGRTHTELEKTLAESAYDSAITKLCLGTAGAASAMLLHVTNAEPISTTVSAGVAAILAATSVVSLGSVVRTRKALAAIGQE